MRTVNIGEAKKHISRLIEGALRGESFVIARAGKPLVKVTALTEPARRARRRIGFLEGQIKVPDDFDTMGRDEIEGMFGLGE